MTIGAGEVEHVARLAELELAADDLARRAHDLERIVALVEQLPPVDGGGDAVVVGPATLRLRDDIVAPIPMTRTPADLAPEFVDGFYVVPALDGLSDE
jgi:aspartyl/glutamyl-tRNA(Asn/Gln) amidotransferase C subunit